jgi:hypothetical protein
MILVVTILACHARPAMNRSSYEIRSERAPGCDTFEIHNLRSLELLLTDVCQVREGHAPTVQPLQLLETSPYPTFLGSKVNTHRFRQCVIDPDSLATGTGTHAGLRQSRKTETRKTRTSGHPQQSRYNHTDRCNVERQPASHRYQYQASNRRQATTANE